MIARYNQTARYVARTAERIIPRKVTKYLVVHHAAWVYKPGTAVQSIFNYHSSKWPKYGRIGYQIVLQEELDGSIARYDVNPEWIQGANVALMNDVCLGICAATNFTGLPPAKWYNALVEVFTEVHRRKPNAVIVGHKDIARKGYETACPGPLWSKWRAEFVHDVHTAMGRS